MVHASQFAMIDSPSTFMEVECLIDTMLHELVHNEIGPHSDKFYDMLEEVRSLPTILKFLRTMPSCQRPAKLGPRAYRAPMLMHANRMYLQLRKECDSLMTGRNGFNVFASTHVPFEGQGSVLGGSAPLGLNRADSRRLREEMAKAAEKRAQV